MPEMLQKLFGDKPWYQSITAWGLVIYTIAMAGGNAACEAGLLSFSACDTVESIGGTIGIVITALGIRKAATAPDTKAPDVE
jgi:hypothetical protein